ncbi:MAG: MFS transporter [Bacteroidota bacterium]
MSVYTKIKVEEYAGTREWFGLVALAIPTLLLSIDTSVLYLALPALSVDLKANSAQQLWIMDIYGFMIAGLLITMGSLGDRIGYRRLLITGSTAFGFASVLAAFSQSSIMLIIARAIMGMAGATLMPSTLALIRNMFVNPKQRGTAISVWMSCFMAGMIAGPLVGGLVLEHFRWGTVFLIDVPVVIVVIFAGPVLVREYHHGDARPLDIPGVIFSLAAILPFVYGLTELSRNNFQLIPILSILAGGIFGIAFVYRENATPNSLIDFSLFTTSSFRITLIAMMLTAAIMGGTALFMAQYLQMVTGLSPFYAGLWMIPQAIGMITGSMVVPLIVSKIRPGIIITTGFLISAVGMLVIAFVPAINGLTLLETGFVMAVTGASPILVLGTGLIIGASPPKKAGAAASVAETGNQLGIALGVAFLGNTGAFFYQKVMANTIPASLTGSAWKTAHESIMGATSVAAGLPGQRSVTLIVSAKEAFVKGLHVVAVSGAIIFAILACITATGLYKVGTVNE